MRSIRRSRRNNLRINADINITNLVDIAFVLLIIFMITAPILQGGIELELPETEAVPLDSRNTVIVSIARDARIYIGDAEVSLNEFESVFPSHLPSKDDPVSIKWDRQATGDPIARVMGMLMGMGYSKLQIVVDPETRRR